MATYKIKDPETGKTIKLTGDSPPTEQELEEIFSKVRGPAEPPEGVLSKIGSLLGTGWESLTIPEKKSREGLKMLSEMVPKLEPSGNLPLDVLKGTPRVAAETLAETAPGFVSRGSILTAGLLKGAQKTAPAVKAIVRGGGKQLESASGLVPGSLEAAYKDPSLIFSKGKEAAKPLYEAARKELPKGANLFEGMWKPEEIVDAAQKHISKGGTLEPSESLIARKATDALLKSKRYVKDALMELRNTFDASAKSSENIKMADPLFRRGIMADALRNFLPQNKFGGASAFKMGIAPALAGLGGFVGGPPGAAAGGAAAAMALSPAVQGGAATVAGILGRNVVAPLVGNPALAVAGKEAIRTFAADKSQSQNTAVGSSKLAERIKTNPQVYGKYAQTLLNAAQRGAQSLTSTDFVLQQRDPEYRAMKDRLDKEEGQ